MLPIRIDNAVSTIEEIIIVCVILLLVLGGFNLNLRICNLTIASLSYYTYFEVIINKTKYAMNVTIKKYSFFYEISCTLDSFMQVRT